MFKKGIEKPSKEKQREQIRNRTARKGSANRSGSIGLQEWAIHQIYYLPSREKAQREVKDILPSAIQGAESHIHSTCKCYVSSEHSRKATYKHCMPSKHRRKSACKHYMPTERTRRPIYGLLRFDG